MNIPTWLPYMEKMWRQRKRGCRRRVYGCLLLLLLGLLLLCGLLAWAIYPAAAQSAEPLSIYLLIDNSNSMFEKEGIGSDPDLLRLDAARLFISYLGVDTQTVHRCGVIFFGSQAQVVVPLTPLTDEVRRAAIFSLIAEPPRMAWTDHVAALSLASSQLQLENPSGRSVIILLTDGKPEWGNHSTAEEAAEYRKQLTVISEQLAEANIPLFIILLANEATDADPDIAQVWQPVWQEMTTATASGHFYSARQAEQLVGIYHDMVVSLTGGQTAGSVVQAVVNPDGVERVVTVEPNLQRLTLVVSKSNPTIAVTIVTPTGEALTAVSPHVSYAGQPGVTREEIWAIDHPMSGQWKVQMTGEGQVMVWKDYETIPVTSSPTSSPTATGTAVSLHPSVAPPSVVATFSPTATPVPTQTPFPILIAPAFSGTKAMGTPAKMQSLSGGGVTGWWWLLPVVLLFLVSSGYGLWHWQSTGQPIVTGTLRVPVGSGTADGQTMIDLDSLNKPQVTIGAAPADVLLLGAAGRVSIRPGTAVGDTYQMLVEGHGPVYLDDESLTAVRQLADSAVIIIGTPPGPVHRLRYENLRLRTAARMMEVSDWHIKK